MDRFTPAAWLFRQTAKRFIEGVSEKSIARFVADLDADEFAARDKATEALRKLGELAEPALRKALATRPALEMRRRVQGLLEEISQRQWQPAPDMLRQLRAVEVLEHLGTPESLRLLEALAKGAEGARQTRSDSRCAASPPKKMSRIRRAAVRDE